MLEENIVLIDEEGIEHTFYVYDTIELEGTEYAILIPEESDGEEAVIFRMEADSENEDEMILIPVDDDDEIDQVIAVLEDLELEGFDDIDDGE